MSKSDSTIAEAVATIKTTADFYHSMDLDSDEPRYYWQFYTALDLLERIQGLEPYSLINAHFDTCWECKERGY